MQESCFFWNCRDGGTDERNDHGTDFKLVHASQKIAANDFFIRDVEVDNKDELGELVRAFNKMKYATGEYIQALEEKRKTLDLLHEEELEKLETEKRLEMTKLELLKARSIRIFCSIP